MSEANNSGKRKGFRSESHELHREIREIVQDLEKVNQEYKGHREHKSKLTPSIAMVWLVFTLVIASMMTTTVGVYLFTQQGFEATLNETTITPATPDPDETDLEPYYGVMLDSLAPVAYTYTPGEEATVEAIINVKDADRLDAVNKYALLDKDGTEIYSFSKKEILGRDENVLKKNILLTENYEPGKYSVEFDSRFKVNDTRYVLSGMTTFWIKEKERPNYVALVGKKLVGMGPLEHILMIAILILNFLLVYNMWNIDREK